MKARLIRIVLLLAMIFNITHASIIATEDHCEHESINEYISEQFASQDCDDLCDIHHLFHLTAIITTPIFTPLSPKYTEQPNSDLLTYHPPFKRTEQKPPIA